MKYASVCAGIEAVTAAVHPMGWTAEWFSEIEKFPSAVLKHHYPTVPNLGDMTKLTGNEIYEKSNFDVLFGGTPCQSFSIAGLRKGLSDDRGNLALEYCRILIAKQPRWFVWENVPGVLSSNGGRDFGTILRAFSECGYSLSYRILDAQYFGVPQRRRRVFVVGHLGNDWRPSAAVLFERESMFGDPAPGRKQKKAVAALTANGVGTCGADDNQEQAGHLIPCWWDGGQISQTLDAVLHKGQTMPEKNRFPAVLYDARNNVENSSTNVVLQQSVYESVSATLKSGSGERGWTADDGAALVDMHSSVRRLTPLECERLQGFPDNYTAIPGAKDGPRYKAIGNSMAVPVMRWIAERIATVDRLNFV